MSIADAQPRAARVRAASRPSVELIVHLARREIALSHRLSFVGAAWPLLRQLVQLGVLVFVFSHVLNLGVPHYPVFVFSGLLGWSWFTTAVSTSSTAIARNRSLAMRPGFPTVVLPVVTSLVPLLDLLVALPVLLVLLLVDTGLSWTLVLLPALLLLQGVLTVGLGWLCASVTVFVRDVPHLVGVALVMAFYVTPVYFDVSRVPDRYEWVLRLNPLAVLLEADRACLLGTPWPPWWNLLGVGGLAIVAVVAGYAAFIRLAPMFPDEL